MPGEHINQVTDKWYHHDHAGKRVGGLFHISRAFREVPANSEATRALRRDLELLAGWEAGIVALAGDISAPIGHAELQEKGLARLLVDGLPTQTDRYGTARPREKCIRRVSRTPRGLRTVSRSRAGIGGPAAMPRQSGSGWSARKQAYSADRAEVAAAWALDTGSARRRRNAWMDRRPTEAVADCAYSAGPADESAGPAGPGIRPRRPKSPFVRQAWKACSPQPQLPCGLPPRRRFRGR